MKPYSNDLREKIVKAYNNKEGSYRQLAKRFDVSLDFIQRLMKQYRETGRVDPKPHGGGASSKLNPTQWVRVEQLITKNPNTTLAQLCNLIEKDIHVRLSIATMSRVVKKLRALKRQHSARNNNQV